MSTREIVTGLIAVGLVVYLTYAPLRPERFSFPGHHL